MRPVKVVRKLAKGRCHGRDHNPFVPIQIVWSLALAWAVRAGSRLPIRLVVPPYGPYELPFQAPGAKIPNFDQEHLLNLALRNFNLRDLTKLLASE